MGRLLISQMESERITVTDLTRDAAALLDEVEIEKASFVIHRYGRPVAVIVPTDDAPRPRRFVRPRRSMEVRPPAPEREETVDQEAVEAALDDDGRRVLQAIAAGGRDGCNPDTRETGLGGLQLAACVSRLEMAGLVQAQGGLFWPTKTGRERAALLEQEHAGG
jgi:antitoxin (DNA-binding transcriptional repressor) of toxin-antitoxin stability system